MNEYFEFQEFGEESFLMIIDGWKGKIERVEQGDQRWGLFYAEKAWKEFYCSFLSFFCDLCLQIPPKMWHEIMITVINILYKQFVSPSSVICTAFVNMTEYIFTSGNTPTENFNVESNGAESSMYTVVLCWVSLNALISRLYELLDRYWAPHQQQK